MQRGVSAAAEEQIWKQGRERKSFKRNVAARNTLFQ